MSAEAEQGGGEQEKPNVRKHGVTGYSRGCRCDVCRAAKRAYNQEQRRKKLAAVEAGEATFEHGYDGYTRWNCRCDTCRSAKAEYQSGRRGSTSGYMKKYRAARREAVAKGAVEVTHGLGGYTNDRCRCDICVDAFRTWRAENPDKQWHVQHPEEANKAQRRKLANWQAETLEKAKRHSMQWTGPELELASRNDLTVREIALMLGRSYASVHNMRKKLKSDPKTIMVAGLPKGPVRPDEEPTT